MRYIIRQEKLDDKHPLWAKQIVYYLQDMFTRKRSLGCYTSREAAQTALKKKEERK